MGGVVGAVNDYKQQHPRRFIGILVACVVVPLMLLGGSSHAPASLASYSKAGVVSLSNAGGVAIAPASISAAVDRNEQLWKHNVEKRKEFIASKGGLDKIRMFTPKSEGGWGQFYTVWDLYLPSFPCFWEMERVGRMVDGGKYMCGLPRIQQQRGSKCVIYSFGVNTESSWEAELLERTDCEVYMYDFSVSTYGPQIHELPAALSARAHFFPYGIGTKDEEVEFDGKMIKLFTLKTLMKMNGHDWLDILKVDIEGAEFSVLPQIVKAYGNNNLPFEELLLEMHVDQTTPKYDAQVFDAVWSGLERAGLRAFAAELNYPSLHFTEYAQAMEIGFLNYGNRRHSKSKLLID